MVDPKVTEFIQDQLRLGKTDSSELALRINQRFGINTNDAQELVENVQKMKSSTTFSYSRPSTSSRTATTGNDFTSSRTNSGNSSSFTSTNSGGASGSVKLDRVSAEKKLIKMRLEKERKKLLQTGGLDDFLESRKSYLCPFEKCISHSLDAEEFKQLSLYAPKNRTHLLYYLYIGLDLERIYLMMNEFECKPEKVQRKLEKLVKEKHPIMMKYSLKNTVNVGYFKKAEQILETKKEPGFVDKIFKLISGGGSGGGNNDNNGSSQKSSSSNQGKQGNNTSQKNHSNHQHSTKPSTSTAQSQSQSPSTIDLSSLNSDSDIIHKMVSFKHDDTRKVYIMKSSKSFKNGKSEVVLRKKNYDFIANQMKGQSMPASINGKVDWADFSGTNLEVGASCKF